MSASLPYAGTSGWSGSDTSRARAVDADESGVTSERQSLVLVHMDHRKGYGITVEELRDLTQWHHGTASGVLSVLHKDHRIDRLAIKRHKCKVYVLPPWVMGRQTEDQGRPPKPPEADVTPAELAEYRRIYGLWLRNTPDEHPVRNTRRRDHHEVLEGQLTIDGLP